jgi:hypothetical protein
MWRIEKIGPGEGENLGNIYLFKTLCTSFNFCLMCAFFSFLSEKNSEVM